MRTVGDAGPYEVTYNGVPIGHVSLTIAELGIGELEPTLHYAAVRDLIRSASRSLWSVGFLSRPLDLAPGRERIPIEIVTRVAELDLELYDDTGVLVPTDFVNVVEHEDASRLPAVFVRFRLERAGTPAVVAPRPSNDSGRNG
jgi:hypothetical protein